VTAVKSDSIIMMTKERDYNAYRQRIARQSTKAKEVLQFLIRSKEAVSLSATNREHRYTENVGR